ncbi:general stress protein [bacterium LRH843]|nr:general stress protein [bacterium LRH843]
MVNRHVVGYYDSEAEAITAIEDLKIQGYPPDAISVISKKVGHVDHNLDETGTHAAEGAATGAATGGVGGVLVGLGAFAIPGIGPIIAGGPIAVGIRGVAVGVGVGGVAGALIGLGISEAEAHRYNEYFNEGKILVLVDGDYQPTDFSDRTII